MDELAHRTVAKIFGGRDPRGKTHPEEVLLENYLQRRRTGQWADLFARHSLPEMENYMKAMEELAMKMGGE